MVMHMYMRYTQECTIQLCIKMPTENKEYLLAVYLYMHSIAYSHIHACVHAYIIHMQAYIYIHIYKYLYIYG